MTASLQETFQRLEKQRVDLLRSLENLPPDQLRSHPQGKWSIQQILEHLVTSERLSLHYLRKKVLGIEQADDSGIWEEMKVVLLIVSQRMPGIRFRAPKPVIEQTTSYADLKSLADDWAQLRQDMWAFLESLPPHRERRKIYRHPVAGLLNIRQTLIFFREHTIHHTPQIQRLRLLK